MELQVKKQLSSNFLKFLQKRFKKVNPRRKLTDEEIKCLTKLETMADKFQRGEYVANRQLETWLREYEYAQLETAW